MSFASRQFNRTPLLSYGEGPAHGPTVSLLQGVTRRWRDWEPFLSALTESFRVIGLDHRGHGDNLEAKTMK